MASSGVSLACVYPPGFTWGKANNWAYNSQFKEKVFLCWQKKYKVSRPPRPRSHGLWGPASEGEWSPGLCLLGSPMVLRRTVVPGLHGSPLVNADAPCSSSALNVPRQPSQYSVSVRLYYLQESWGHRPGSPNCTQ